MLETGVARWMHKPSARPSEICENPSGNMASFPAGIHRIDTPSGIMLRSSRDGVGLGFRVCHLETQTSEVFTAMLAHLSSHRPPDYWRKAKGRVGRERSRLGSQSWCKTRASQQFCCPMLSPPRFQGIHQGQRPRTCPLWLIIPKDTYMPSAEDNKGNVKGQHHIITQAIESETHDLYQVPCRYSLSYPQASDIGRHLSLSS